VILARGASGTRALPRLREVSPYVSLIDTDLASKASVEAAAVQVEDLLDAGELPSLRGIHLVHESASHPPPPAPTATRSSVESYDAARERTLWDWLEQV
jgi:hypothetical protein